MAVLSLLIVNSRKFLLPVNDAHLLSTTTTREKAKLTKLTDYLTFTLGKKRGSRRRRK